MRLLLSLPLLFAMFAGCGGEPGVQEFTIHIGWNADGTTQYLEPSEIRVAQGTKVRFVITNDDDPNKDYNGNGAGRDNFHDVAFGYGGAFIEHEVPAGMTVKTCLVQQTPCPEGKDFFVASEKGTFKLFCEVGPLGKNPDGTTKTRHEQVGMKGVLIVE